MKKVILLLCISLVLACQEQTDDYTQEIRAYREEQNAKFLAEKSSPLSAAERQQFTGHEYFPIDEAYRVKARFEATPDAKPFQLGTSTGGTQLYRRLGILHFDIEGQPQTLEAYLRVQGFGLAAKVNYVFLPLIDATSGVSTYDAGRYLHFDKIPEGKEWIIDFNKLYNPLCAYNPNYECPMVPSPNHLDVAIKAGVKGYWQTEEFK